MGETVFREDGNIDAYSSQLALAVMSTLETLHARIQVVRAALLPVLTPALVEEWDELEKSLRARARERNSVAHAAWSISEEFPDDLLVEERSGRVLRYTAQDFAEIAARIGECRRMVERFLAAIHESIREGSVRVPSAAQTKGAT